MNGRVYDYNVGRFMSVDPVIQSPGNSQSINPYSYVMNNPLAMVDPTGYSGVAAEESKVETAVVNVKTKKVAVTGSRIKREVVSEASGVAFMDNGSTVLFEASYDSQGGLSGGSITDLGNMQQLADRNSNDQSNINGGSGRQVAHSTKWQDQDGNEIDKPKWMNGTESVSTDLVSSAGDNLGKVNTYLKITGIRDATKVGELIEQSNEYVTSLANAAKSGDVEAYAELKEIMKAANIYVSGVPLYDATKVWSKYQAKTQNFARALAKGAVPMVAGEYISLGAHMSGGALKLALEGIGLEVNLTSELPSVPTDNKGIINRLFKDF